MSRSTPGFPVLHQLPELAQTHVRRVGDALQPSLRCRPLLLPPSVFASIRVFSSESALRIRGQRTGASASASLFPLNIQGVGKCIQQGSFRDFPGGPGLRLHAPTAGGLGSIPGRGTRPHMQQLRVHNCSSSSCCSNNDPAQPRKQPAASEDRAPRPRQRLRFLQALGSPTHACTWAVSQGPGVWGQPSHDSRFTLAALGLQLFCRRPAETPRLAKKTTGFAPELGTGVGGPEHGGKGTSSLWVRM